MFRTLHIFILASMLLLSSHYAAWAEDVVIPINHYPPWKIVEEGRIDGINVKLTRTLLQQIDLNARFIVRPWKRELKMMEKGSADLMSGLLKTPEREKYMIFLEPPYKKKSIKSFFVRKGESGRIREYADLTGLLIGTTLGTRYFKKFDEDSTLTKDMVKDTGVNLKKLLNHRVDTFITTETVGDYLIARQGLQSLVEKAEYKYSAPLPVYFAVSRKSSLAARVPELSSVLKKMIESGEVDKIINEFIGRPTPDLHTIRQVPGQNQ